MVEQQGRNAKGQFKSFKETKIDTANEINQQTDEIAGKQDNLKLAKLLIDDRKKRSLASPGGQKPNEIAKQFATLNNTFGILGKTLSEYKSIGQGQIDVVNELKTITEEAEFASAKDQKKMLREVDTQIKILKEVENQTDPKESPVLAEALKTQKLLQKNSRLLDQMNEGLSSVLVKGFGAILGAFGDSPILAMGAQFVGNKITERQERKRAEDGKVRTAIRKKQDTEQDDLVNTIGPGGGDQIDDLVHKKTKDVSKETGISPDVLRESVYAGINDGMKAALAEAIQGETDPEIKEELKSIWESLSGDGGVVDAVLRVETGVGLMSGFMDEGNVEAIRQFKKQQRDAVEARRDKKANVLRPGDGFGSEDNKADDDEGGLIQGLKDRFVITARGIVKGLMAAFGWIAAGFVKLGTGIKTLFSGKAIGFLLKKALPIAAMGYALFKGGQAAIEEYKKTGDIMEATGAFFGQIAETLTFGLLKKDKLKEWGTSLGVWIEDKIIEYGSGIKGILQGPIDKIKVLFDEIASWFSWISELDIRDFIPEKMATMMEDLNIIDTKREKQDKALAKQFDSDADEGIRARATAAGLTEDDVEALIKQREATIEERAEQADITVIQYKSIKQQQALDARSEAPDNVVPINSPVPARGTIKRDTEAAVAPMVEAVQSASTKVSDLQSAENEQVVAEIKSNNDQMKKIKMVESQSNEIETAKIRRAEAIARKAQQPRMVQQNSSTTNNSQTNVLSGGPSDDDNMYNRHENQQRVG